jgi:hypothetical protein
MHRYIMAVVLAVVLCGCEEEKVSSGTPVVVGTKTPLYEVIAKNQLKLMPGAKIEVTPGPDGKGSGFIVYRQNSAPGGYMSCGCVGAQTSSCTISSDNPDNNPTCSGSCTDSEGNPHSCEIETWTGPPKDPPQFWARAPARE